MNSANICEKIVKMFETKFPRPIKVGEYDIRNYVTLKHYNILKKVKKFDIVFIILNDRYLVTKYGLEFTLSDLINIIGKLETDGDTKIADVKLIAIEDENDENSYVWYEWFEILPPRKKSKTGGQNATTDDC